MNVLLRHSPDGSYPYSFWNDEGAFPSEEAGEMSVESFETVLNALSYSDPNQEIRFVWGEPTGHSRFSEILTIIERKGFKKVVIHSSGNFDHRIKEALRSSGLQISFSWNLNPLPKASEQIRKNVNEVVREFSIEGASASFHIDRPEFDASFVLDFLAAHPQIQSVGIGISHPMADIASKNRNAVFTKDLPEVGNAIFEFVKTVVENPTYAHVSAMGLHCGYVPCLWTDEQREFLGKTWRFAFEECSPELTDVLPNLSINGCLTRCAPKGKYGLADFSHPHEAYFQNAARYALSKKYLPSASPKCDGCEYRSKCFGGCLGERTLRAKLEIAKLLSEKKGGFLWRKSDAWYRTGTLLVGCSEFDKGLDFLRKSAMAAFFGLRFARWMKIENEIEAVEAVADFDVGKNRRASLEKAKSEFEKERGKALFDQKLLSNYAWAVLNDYFDGKFLVRKPFTERMSEVSANSLEKKRKDREVHAYLKRTEWVKFSIEDAWTALGHAALLRISRGDEATWNFFKLYFDKNPQKEDVVRNMTRGKKSEWIIGDMVYDLLDKYWNIRADRNL